MTYTDFLIAEKQWREFNRTALAQDIADMGIKPEEFTGKLKDLEEQIAKLELEMESRNYILGKRFEKTMIRLKVPADDWSDRWELWDLAINNNYNNKLKTLYGELHRIRNTVGLAGGGKLQDLEKAKQYPIESLIDTPIRMKGEKKWTNCPFHEDKTPSFMIDTQNTCHCFSCGFNGDSIELTRKLFGLSFLDAVRKLS